MLVRRTAVRTVISAVLALAATACSRDDRAAGAQGVGDTIGTARRQAVIGRPTTPYRVVSVPTPGRVAGTLRFDGTPHGDTLIVVPADQNGCGKPLTIQRLARQGDRVAGAVVWLTDVRAGVPLTNARRYELENADCSWTPQLQAVVAGGALDVQNFDPLVERARAMDVASGDTVAIAPFTDDGQVIPYDVLLRTPGIYEWSVESRPMSRAWVAVFDQPYFALSGADGAFAMDGVPPGTHRVRAWHPMLGVVDGTVTVPASGTGTVELQFR